MRNQTTSAGALLVLVGLIAATTAATGEPRPFAAGAGAPSAASPEATIATATEALPSAPAADATAARVAAAGTFATGSGAYLERPGLAVEADVGAFLSRFEGEWRGNGMVIGDAGDPPRRVSCMAIGTTGPTSVDIAGDCRMLAIFKRPIGATLVHHGDGFTGTYVGSRIGDARLAGDVEADTLVMTMEWPEEVNGDTTAEMRITNAGDGTLTLEVVDEIDGEDGSETFVATELVFEKVETAR